MVTPPTVADMRGASESVLSLAMLNCIVHLRVLPLSVYEEVAFSAAPFASITSTRSTMLPVVSSIVILSPGFILLVGVMLYEGTTSESYIEIRLWSFI